MASAVEGEDPARQIRTSRPKTSASRETRQLQTLYDNSRSQYLETSLCSSIEQLIESKNRPVVTRILSLGLGSLKSTNQSRRVKQLTIFLAIAEQLQRQTTGLEIYAQDPSFTKTDEVFLQSLGVRIISTPSATELGEAAQYLDESTLVYCPFLTLEAYQLLLSAARLTVFIGDDFDALKVKWPKHSAGRLEAESLSRTIVQKFRKRTISSGDGFWVEDDKPFPMAMYWNAPKRKQPDVVP
jgi:hypothetical protein